MSEIKEADVTGAVKDQVENVFDRAKEQLLKIQCSEHGQALKTLDFDKSNGRFKIETCCSAGEALINNAITSLI